MHPDPTPARGQVWYGKPDPGSRHLPDYAVPTATGPAYVVTRVDSGLVWLLDTRSGQISAQTDGTLADAFFCDVILGAFAPDARRGPLAAIELAAAEIHRARAIIVQIDDAQGVVTTAGQAWV